MPPKKAFQVQVELGVQSVSCPGVWLCPNGKVSLQLYMMDSSVQTTCVEPLFPLIFQQKFVFCKKFFTAKKLNELQKALSRQILYVELVQWQTCDSGNVLASFQTTLSELLYPGSKSLTGTEIDLLMEPMKHFPGILHPKVEVSTKTIVEDILCDEDRCGSYVVNPYTISSALLRPAKNNNEILRQKRVCHTTRYHQQISKCICSKVFPHKVSQDRLDQCSRPCNCYGYKEDKLTLQSGKTQKLLCKNTNNHKTLRCVNKCACGEEHQENCAICAKYKHYFENANEIKSMKNLKSETDTDRNVVSDNRNIECFTDCCKPPMVKLCNYPTSPSENDQISLVRRIHNRLTDSLNHCMTYNSNICSPCGGECCERIGDSECSPKSFGQMYKDLYSCQK